MGHSSWLRPTTITWTSELEKYRPIFEEIVQECAAALPGFDFYLLRRGEVYKDFKDTDEYIKGYLQMDSERGCWTINSHPLVSSLTSEIMNFELRNLTIVFTRQPISGKENCRYDDYDTRSAIISLEFCNSDDEIRKAASVMLRHVLGHIYLGRNETHCDNPYCIIHRMSSRESIMQHIAPSAKYSGFCEGCWQKVQKSRIWVNEPSCVSDSR